MLGLQSERALSAQEGGRAAPQLQLLSQGDEQGPALSPHLFRRVLELLGYLVRSNERLATAAVSLRIGGPTAATAAAVAEAPDTKGKQRAGGHLPHTLSVTIASCLTGLSLEASRRIPVDSTEPMLDVRGCHRGGCQETALRALSAHVSA